MENDKNLSSALTSSFSSTTKKTKTFISKKSDDYSEYSTLKVAMCQVYTEEWAFEANIKRTLEAIDLASKQGAEIAVTPECVFHGYPIDATKGKSKLFRKKLYNIAESLDGEHLQLFKGK
jgi:hypothetical protein